MRFRPMFITVLFSGALLLSCSGRKPSTLITQITDPSAVTGVVSDGATVWCATRGGLIEWNIKTRTFTVSTTANGLPSNILSDVVLDGKKRLWIGSESGVAVREGSGWKRYGGSGVLPSDMVNDLAVDPDGNVWAATDRGVVSFAGSGPKFLNEKGGPDTLKTSCVFFDLGKNLWIGTPNDGIFAKIQGTWRDISSKDGLLLNAADTIAQDWDNSIWAASWGGICRWDGLGFQSFGLKKYVGTYNVRELMGTRDSFWYFTANGVHMSKGSEWIHYTENEGLVSNDVLSGYIDGGGRVYAGTESGLSILENGVPVTFSVPNVPFGHEFISLAVDGKGRLLAGTDGSGVSILDAGLWGRLAGPDEKSFDTVRSFVFGPDSTIVFNTSKGILTWRNGTWKISTRDDGISGDDIRSGAFDTQGNYWVATSAGVSCLRGGTWTRYRQIHGLPSENAWMCAADSSGTVWAATSRGIVSFKGNELTNWTDKAVSDSLDARSVAVAGGKVFFGTATGKLVTFDGSSWKVSSVSSHPVTCIIAEPSGTLWLATDGGGIVRFDGKNSQTFTGQDGLPSDHVQALALKDGKLIAACHGGLAEIALNTGK